MKISDIVDNTIKRLPNGYVFTYTDFDVDVKHNETVRRYLGKMVAEGRIVRESRGRFYKPEQSSFGVLPVPIHQALKDLLEDGSKRIGYITGYSAFNELKLTTQVPSSYQLATNVIKKPIMRGRYRIRFTLQKNIITKDNIPLLKILDCIKLIKSIPDTTINQSVVRINSIVRELSDGQTKEIIRLSMKYPPSTRALLGAIIEDIYTPERALLLRESLNGISRYKLNISEDILPDKQNWNIQ